MASKRYHLTKKELEFLKSKKIGLLLSGGASHGYAEIGAAKILEEYSIIPDYVVGVSVGSLVGTAVAAGISMKVLEDYFLSLKPISLVDLSLRGLGFIKGDKIVNNVLKVIEVSRFSQLKIPLAVTATNVNTGNTRVFTQGFLSPALHASIAIPGLFAPKKIGSQYYVDGGVYSPLPIGPFPPSLDLIIIVDVSTRHTKIDEQSSSLQVFRNSVMIMTKRMAMHKLEKIKEEKPVIYVQPPVADISILDLRKKRAMDMLRLGEYTMRRELKRQTRRLIRAEQRRLATQEEALESTKKTT